MSDKTLNDWWTADKQNFNAGGFNNTRFNTGGFNTGGFDAKGFNSGGISMNNIQPAQKFGVNLDNINWGTDGAPVKQTDVLGNMDALSKLPAGATDTTPAFWSMDGFMGNDKQLGWGSAGLSTARLGMESWLGLQELGVAKDKLDFQKDAFSRQFENQRTLTNAELRDRQDRRNSANPNVQSTADYMRQNGV